MQSMSHFKLKFFCYSNFFHIILYYDYLDSSIQASGHIVFIASIISFVLYCFSGCISVHLGSNHFSGIPSDTMPAGFSMPLSRAAVPARCRWTGNRRPSGTVPAYRGGYATAWGWDSESTVSFTCRARAAAIPERKSETRSQAHRAWLPALRGRGTADRRCCPHQQ